jgi:ribosome-binding factor A
MLVKTNFRQVKLQSLYEREISIILKKIIQWKEFPFFSVSYCELSTKAEKLKVYLLFTSEKNQKYLKIINQNYLPVVKKYLAKSKKFARLPKITFLLDQELKKINELAEMVQKFK